MKDLLYSASARSCWSTARQPAWSYRALLALAGLVALVGCHNPAAQRRMAARQRSLQTTADVLTHRERIGVQRLQRAADFIREDVNRDKREFRRDLRALKAHLEVDLRRWQERQGSYREKLGEIFGGRPENIEPTVILFL